MRMAFVLTPLSPLSFNMHARQLLCTCIQTVLYCTPVRARCTHGSWPAAQVVKVGNDVHAGQLPAFLSIVDAHFAAVAEAVDEGEADPGSLLEDAMDSLEAHAPAVLAHIKVETATTTHGHGSVHGGDAPYRDMTPKQQAQCRAGVLQQALRARLKSERACPNVGKWLAACMHADGANDQQFLMWGAMGGPCSTKTRDSDKHGGETKEAINERKFHRTFAAKVGKCRITAHDNLQKTVRRTTSEGGNVMVIHTLGVGLDSIYSPSETGLDTTPHLLDTDKMLTDPSALDLYRVYGKVRQGEGMMSGPATVPARNPHADIDPSFRANCGEPRRQLCEAEYLEQLVYAETISIFWQLVDRANAESKDTELAVTPLHSDAVREAFAAFGAMPRAKRFVPGASEKLLHRMHPNLAEALKPQPVDSVLAEQGDDFVGNAATMSAIAKAKSRKPGDHATTPAEDQANEDLRSFVLQAKHARGVELAHAAAGTDVTGDAAFSAADRKLAALQRRVEQSTGYASSPARPDDSSFCRWQLPAPSQPPIWWGRPWPLAWCRARWAPTILCWESPSGRRAFGSRSRSKLAHSSCRAVKAATVCAAIARRSRRGTPASTACWRLRAQRTETNATGSSARSRACCPWTRTRVRSTKT